MAGVLAAWALLPISPAWWVVAPLLALFAISLLDDMRGLSAQQRLLVHIGAAMALAAGSGVVGLGVLPVVAVMLSAVWAINLYNFMDGSDGLAGGMALIGFGIYGAAALIQGDETQALLNFSISAAALGFLCYNFYPAKVFMGDAGYVPLGFLAAAMGLLGWQQGLWPAWFPFLVFSAGFNGTLKKIVEAREKGDYAGIKGLDKDLAFHGSGVVRHNLYWENLCPKAESKELVSGVFLDQVKMDFGDLAKLKTEMGAAAKAVEGSGWAVLVWVPASKQLLVLHAENHQKLTIWGVVPLLVIDVWEHAYYLKYQNRRPEYVTNWWNVVNWEEVARRYAEAK